MLLIYQPAAHGNIQSQRCFEFHFSLGGYVIDVSLIPAWHVTSLSHWHPTVIVRELMEAVLATQFSLFLTNSKELLKALV